MKKLVLLLLLQGGLAVADVVPVKAADKDGFQPVSDKDLERARVDETIPGANLIAGAYGFIFGAVILYAWNIGRRANRVEGELDNLSARVAKKLDELNAASKKS